MHHGFYSLNEKVRVFNVLPQVANLVVGREKAYYYHVMFEKITAFSLQ